MLRPVGRTPAPSLITSPPGAGSTNSPPILRTNDAISDLREGREIGRERGNGEEVESDHHHIISHPIPSHLITSYHITLHHITSHHITSHHIISHHIISYHITSHPIISYHITSHLITSHHIPSNHITRHLEFSHSMRASCSALKMSKLTPSFATSPVHSKHNIISQVSTCRGSHGPPRVVHLSPLFDFFGDFEPMEII
jgi:hypothetical protein